mgnify:FL=1
MATNKYFKCPYCDKKFTREDMVIHLDKKHSNLLPEGFTPLRMTFHIVNRKDVKYRRPCRVCKNPTEWDENKGRYNFLCGSERCHDEYVKIMYKTMGEKAGINRQTKTAEGLEKMLANRRISGKYKFTDGKIVAYTGTYEKKALEFFDLVMNIKSDDLMVPGPPLRYRLDDKEHIYIPDMYYIPYDLIIEVKTGGDRPNNNPQWKETRRKQLAKEEYIIKHTDYNYIRLTDNNFSQILSVFADLKMSTMEENTSRIIHVNESSNLLENTPAGSIAPMVGMDDVIIVNYLKKNTFDTEPKIAISDNITFDNLFALDKDNIFKNVGKEFLEDCDYSTYILKNGKVKANKLSDKLDSMIESYEIYRTLFGHDKLTNDQIMFENGIEQYNDFYHTVEENNKRLYEFVNSDDKKVVTDIADDSRIPELYNRKTIVFDFGKVLIDCYSRDLLYTMGYDKNDVDYLVELICVNIDKHISQEASYEEHLSYFKKICAQKYIKDADDIYKIITTSVRPYYYTEFLLKLLKEKGYRLYYLSNWDQLSFEMAVENGVFDFIKYFDGGIISYQEGTEKPNRDIYELLIHRYNLEPQDMIFFDDRIENITAANEFGIAGILFNDKETPNKIIYSLKSEEIPKLNELYKEVGEINGSK